MLAVWMCTEVNDAFPEAWHSDSAAVQSDGVANIRSKVYLSPKLWYVRVNVIEAQDLQPSDKGRFPEVPCDQYGSTSAQRAEPPLRKEVVEYMVDSDSHMWSIRRSKANFFRIMSILSPLIAIGKWFDEICNWKNPITTVLVHILFLILVWYPELILPTVFLYMFLIGLWNFRFRPRHPPHMDTHLSHAESVHPDELDEEFDTFPTSRGADIVKMRYDRLRSVAGRIQTVVGDIATQGERAAGPLKLERSSCHYYFCYFLLTGCYTSICYALPSSCSSCRPVSNAPSQISVSTSFGSCKLL
ncbi:hypothetical protein KI387_042855 [Taxus chinensis]|uniref:Multiple C2 domain-containing protein n=1 Tax=Taxus chinensis TaxID=29808 RepID=A0AA38C0C5_TAXCH|nr:hypothetical protein KI387_042855 [Taxus chinensis]